MASTPEPIEGFTFYTRAETAAILGASTRQIERWVAQRRLGCTRLGARTLHTPEQIAAFVKANTFEAAS